jgi:hypothetical protein
MEGASGGMSWAAAAHGSKLASTHAMKLWTVICDLAVPCLVVEWVLGLNVGVVMVCFQT